MNVDIKIVLEINPETKVTLTETEAKQLQTKLNTIFPTQQFYPIYPQYPLQDPFIPWWNDPHKITYLDRGSVCGNSNKENS